VSPQPNSLTKLDALNNKVLARKVSPNTVLRPLAGQQEEI
jgi:hypothetical protein